MTRARTYTRLCSSSSYLIPSSVSASQRIDWLPLDASGILYVTTPGWNTVVAQARREGMGNSKFAFVHYYVCMHAHSTGARIGVCMMPKSCV